MEFYVWGRLKVVEESGEDCRRLWENVEVLKWCGVRR